MSHPSFTAVLATGEVIKEDNIYERSETFETLVRPHIASSGLISFSVSFPGKTFAVDLVTGQFIVGSEMINVEQLASPLRLIYYKVMSAGAGETPLCDCVVLGWQATVLRDGKEKNVRLGIKVYPSKAHFELSEDI